MMTRIGYSLLRQNAPAFNLSVANFHITANLASTKSDLAKLRKKTGYTLSLCKKALSESGNNIELAENWLKEQALAQGWAKANKLQGRNTSQGLLGVKVRGNTAASVELKCETDFVARNDKFMSVLDSIADTCLANPAPSILQQVGCYKLSSAEVGKLSNPKDSGSCIADLLALNIGQLGENMEVGHATVVHSSPDVKLAVQSHPHVNCASSRLMCGRFTAVLAYSSSGQGSYPEGVTEDKLISQICQHIIGLAPTAINNEDDKDNSLHHQAFLMDEGITVGDLLAESGITVVHFERREIGRED